MTDLIRSKAINNIPDSKFNSIIEQTIEKCEVCSKKGLSLKDGVDGLCNKCSLTVIVLNRYNESNIPIEYWKLKMEKDFKGDTRLLEKYNNYILNLKNNYINGSSICFAGGHGVGKTTISTCILKKAVQKGYTGLYIIFSDMVNTLMLANNEDKFLARKELTMVDFLVIDEVDVRFFNQSELANEMFSRVFESIIRTRLQNKLPIIMATNSPNIKESFVGLFKASLSSLFNNMSFFTVLGTDFRSTK